MNLRPSGYEPDELPGCSIPRQLTKLSVLGLCISSLESFDLDFTRFGGELLSHALRRSTIAAAVLNFRVRDGPGCFTCAMTTKPRKIHSSSMNGFGGRQGICGANARCRT